MSAEEDDDDGEYEDDAPDLSNLDIGALEEEEMREAQREWEGMGYDPDDFTMAVRRARTACCAYDR